MRLSSKTVDETKLDTQNASGLSRQSGKIKVLNQEDLVEPQETWAQKVVQFMSHRYFQNLSDLLTMLSIYMGFLQILVLPMEYDLILDILVIFMVSFFCFEILLKVIQTRAYLYSVDFLINILSIFSILADHSWVLDSLYSQLAGQDFIDMLGNNMESASYNQYLARNRIEFRGLTLLRIIKFYQEDSNGQNLLSRQFQKHQKSQDLRLTMKVSKTLISQTILNTLPFILLIYVIQNLFQVHEYPIVQYQFDFLLTILSDNTVSNVERLDYYNDLKNYYKEDLLKVKFPVISIDEGMVKKYRVGEVIHLISGDNEMVISDASSFKQDALMQILALLYVQCVYTGAFLNLKSLFDSIISKPILEIVRKTKYIAHSPLEILQVFEHTDQEKDNQLVETTFIEKQIEKIGGLLGVGFGEAGSMIISNHFQSAGGQFAKGNKKIAIFGFCDIRNFTDVTEEDVMVFVNTIADMVHNEVTRNLGGANKNIGDAFLLVWRYRSQYYEFKGTEIALQDCKQVQNFADFSLVSLINIVIKLKREKEILAFNSDEHVQQHLPGFVVKMGCGLHYGWAIEGAIGSKFKIDASYLANNVNVAMDLEAATKIYLKEILVSEDLYKVLNPFYQEICRKVDIVELNMEKKALYCVDIDLSHITVESELDEQIRKITNENTYKIKQQNLTNCNNANYDTSKLLGDPLYHPILPNRKVHLQQKEAFYTKFDEGFDLYIQGQWPQSYEILSQCIGMKPNDGPTLNILKQMKQHNEIAPKNWKGFNTL